jgi:hypothetical protein
MEKLVEIKLITTEATVKSLLNRLQVRAMIGGDIADAFLARLLTALKEGEAEVRLIPKGKIEDAD